MGVITIRPDSTISVGGATLVGGATVHGILSDDSDASYIEFTNKAQTNGNMATFTLGDLSTVPAGAKLKKVTVRVRVPRSVPASGSNLDWNTQHFMKLIEAIIIDSITGQYTKLFEDLFALFSPPKVASDPGGTVWETVTWFTVNRTASGGEWTVANFNAQNGALGRISGTTSTKYAELYLDVEYNERPVAMLTSPTDAQIITATTRPSGTWTYTDTEDDRQQAFDVRVFTAAQVAAGGFSVDTTVPVARTGTATAPWVAGEDLSWIVPVDLNNGDYRMYLRVRQVWDGPTDHVSAWDYVDFTQNVPGPPAPVLAGTYDPYTNKIVLDVVKGGPTPSTETYNFYSSDDAGFSWQMLPDGFQVVAVGGSGTAQLEDQTAPLGSIRKYKVLAYRTIGSVKVASDPSNIVDVLPRSTDFWWKDLDSPSLNFAVPVSSDTPQFDRIQGVFKPLTAVDTPAYFKVINGPEGSMEGELELTFEGPDETSGYNQFRDIYSPGRRLLFQYPTGEQRYVVLGGNVAIPSWAPRDEDVYYRFAKLKYYEVEPPDFEAEATG